MNSLPHLYPAGEPKRYITQQQTEHKSRLSVTFIIEHKNDGYFCGLAEIRAIEREHSQAELSFWIAVNVWGRGYMSEAVHELVQYTIDTIGLNRIYAYRMSRNLDVFWKKWGQFEDVALWAILRKDII